MKDPVDLVLLLKEARSRVVLPAKLIRVQDGDFFDPGHAYIDLQSGWAAENTKPGDYAGHKLVYNGYNAPVSCCKLVWAENPAYQETLDYLGRIDAAINQYNADDNIPWVEAWHREKKVTVYRDCIIRSWGPSLDEIADEPRTLQAVQNAIDWLYASPITDAARLNWAESHPVEFLQLLTGNDDPNDTGLPCYSRPVSGVRADGSVEMSAPRWDIRAAIDKVRGNHE